MRKITEKHASELADQLTAAAQQLREHAASHLYRADAHKAIGDRIMARYHSDTAEQVHDLASRLHGQARAIAASPRVTNRGPSRAAAIAAVPDKSAAHSAA